MAWRTTPGGNRRRVVISDPPADRIEPARKNNPQGLDLRAEAERWVLENPSAYELVKRFALEAARTGRRFGMKLVVERVRWESFLIGEEDGYKVNNNHTAYLARKLVADRPQLTNLLQFRQTRY